MGCVIELTSITYAIKAREILRKNKFKVTVEKSTGKTRKGCAYSVVVNGDCQRAKNVLENAGIRMLGIT